MGKEKERKMLLREQRRAKTRLNGGGRPALAGLAEAVANGELQLAEVTTVIPPPPLLLTTSTPPAPLALSAPKTPAPAPNVEEGSTELHSGSNENYQSYFALLASLPSFVPLKQVMERGGGWYCFEQAFIPGPAYKLHFGNNGRVRIFAATFDVEIETPTSWMRREDLPAEVKEALARRLDLIEGLGAEPTPWVAKRGLAILNGKPLVGDLAMAFSCFRWGDREVAFGLIYGPEGDGKVRVTRVYNPQNLTGAPTEGTLLSLEAIRRGGTGPHHKILRTWTKMEIAAAKAQNDLRARRHQTLPPATTPAPAAT